VEGFDGGLIERREEDACEKQRGGESSSGDARCGAELGDDPDERGEGRGSEKYGIRNAEAQPERDAEEEECGGGDEWVVLPEASLVLG
jgi:hypothetical protein